MPAIVSAQEIQWKNTVDIDFGITGVDRKYALAIVRELIREQWPDQRRGGQCVYVVRLTGDFAVHYPKRHSPVIYIGEGDAYARVTEHAGKWLVDLVTAIPRVGISIRVAEALRRGRQDFYQYIEADMLRMFRERNGSVPWFNRQSERSREGRFEYSDDALREIRTHLGIGRGTSYKWAIRPTSNNDAREPYMKGRERQA